MLHHQITRVSLVQFLLPISHKVNLCHKYVDQKGDETFWRKHCHTVSLVKTEEVNKVNMKVKRVQFVHC